MFAYYKSDYYNKIGYKDVYIDMYITRHFKWY